MGFSSTFVTDWGGLGVFPEWFVEKWKESVHFGSGMEGALPLASKIYGKANGAWETLERDIQKAYPWNEKFAKTSITLVYLHECGGITRIEISEDRLVYHDPIVWQKGWSNVAHDWGDKCMSQIENAQEDPND